MSELTDKIDRFGHCVMCGDNLLTKRVVNGKVVDMFLPTYSDTMFLLNNASQMQVTICKMCKAKNELTSPKIQAEIMSACIKGWDLESRLKVEDKQMTEEQRDKLLDHVKTLGIDCHSENLDKNVIQAKQMELLKAVVEDLKEDSIIEEIK